MNAHFHSFVLFVLPLPHTHMKITSPHSHTHTHTRTHTHTHTHTLSTLSLKDSVTHFFSHSGPHTSPLESTETSHTRCLTLHTVSFSSCGQEPRERHPLPDHTRLRPGHGHRSGPLPAAEERPEQADDWRVFGEQQAAVQQRCPRVSPHYLYAYIYMHH